MLDSYATTGELVAARAKVWGACKCGRKRSVDLARTIAANGAAYRFTNKQTPCDLPGCNAWCHFYARVGFRRWPLSTDAGVIRSDPVWERVRSGLVQRFG